MPQAGFIGYAAGLIAYVSVGSYGFANAAVVSAGIFHLDREFDTLIRKK